MGMNRWPLAARGRGVAATALLSAAMLTVGMTAALAAPAAGHGTTPTGHGAARAGAQRQAKASTLAAHAGPALKLIAVERLVEAQRFGRWVYVDPDIYLASLESAFQIDVSRVSYTQPVHATQVIRTADGNVYRPLPSWVISGWDGIRHFIRITISNASGRVVGASDQPFCSDSGQLAKATPNSAATDPYPSECGSGDPFPMAEVWGLSRGWAVDDYGYIAYRLALGTYKLTETIAPQYVRLFHISRRDATATVRLKVVKQGSCCGPEGCCLPPVPAGFVRASRAPAAGHVVPRPPATATLKHVPEDALPDLIPLPSWGISVSNTKKTRTAFLDFGATVWISGNSPLDVEGFRVPGTGKMLAYQYFYKDGRKLVGRIRVGTMGFSAYNAWHFNQFAQYFLLNKHMRIVVRSRKVGFCIAPTDNVDMVERYATWQPSYTGIEGNCGDPSALWATEILPIGWGDTYIQTVPYQSFDITKIPNGTYYIEIVANPEHLLREISTANDVSLRKVIISGKPGHRTVRVPAWHGMDPENGSGGGYYY
jgi:hypothetical protein